jgi:hypothetical protein
MTRRIITILWPAFLMAGVLEALVFVVVDPADFRWFGHEQVNLSRQAVYTVIFLIFWAAIGVAGALTAWLAASADELNTRR